MNGRTIPPYSIHDPSKSDADYPKHLQISFRNMPHCLSKEDIVTSCGLKSLKLGEIIHQHRRLPNANLFYTGFARVDAIIENLDEKTDSKSGPKMPFNKVSTAMVQYFNVTALLSQLTRKKPLKSKANNHLHKRSRLQNTWPEKQAESTIETQQKQSDYVTITSAQEVTCEIEAVQSEQDAQDMECHSSSEEETPENNTRTVPASKIQKRQKPTHYFDHINPLLTSVAYLLHTSNSLKKIETMITPSQRRRIKFFSVVLCLFNT